jgi:hypothetical protein
MLKGRAVKEPTKVQRQTVYWESFLHARPQHDRWVGGLAADNW